ncbi:MAG: peptide chain release factor 1 [Candidatus Desulfofervidaceae bacterium]|nr:peptide chain release factor 1 [Candidatus Desulfofervidaceae bacterium]
MWQKLDEVEGRFVELEQALSDPAVLSNQEQYRRYVKEHAELSKIVHAYREYKKLDEELEENKELLRDKDEEIRALAKAEIAELKEKLAQKEEELRILLLPKDPNDERNVILEIRAGTGGEEAALFAADLFKMYTKYAESRGWKVDILNSHFTGMGGIKEIIAAIEGKGAYSRLKYESGVHRVQRVPETESQGRIHTSAVTVAILPEAEEVDVDIDPKDLKIDVFRASGPGGQNVNKLETAVRITHIPTGIVVQCQDERSQLKNKIKAMKILRARLLEKKQQEQEREIAEQRRLQVGTGDRSERIRTYNFPQGRVTDHRIGLTLYRLEEVLEGDLDEIIDALITHFQAEAIKNMNLQ